jgi:hypothetical protein
MRFNDTNKRRWPQWVNFNRMMAFVYAILLKITIDWFFCALHQPAYAPKVASFVFMIGSMVFLAICVVDELQKYNRFKS